MKITVNAITSERTACSPRRNLMQGNSFVGRAGTKTRRAPLVAAASLAGLVLVGMLPSTGRAQSSTTPPTSSTIWACYTPSGSVYVVNPPSGELGRTFGGAPTKCASPTHQLFHFDDTNGA